MRIWNQHLQGTVRAHFQAKQKTSNCILPIWIAFLEKEFGSSYIAHQLFAENCLVPFCSQ